MLFSRRLNDRQPHCISRVERNRMQKDEREKRNKTTTHQNHCHHYKTIAFKSFASNISDKEEEGEEVEKNLALLNISFLLLHAHIPIEYFF